MIDKNQFDLIGKLSKPHGISGEINAKLSVDLSPLLEDKEESSVFLMLEFNNLLVPFRLFGYRDKGEELALLKFKDIDTKEQAMELVGVSVYLSKTYLDSEEEGVVKDLQFFIGFDLFDEDKRIGKVIDIDDSTLNTLALIAIPSGEEVMVPFAEELIKDIDLKSRKMNLTIPSGLLDL